MMHTHKKSSHSRGFTLIELTIVLSILGIILPAVFALFLAHIRAQTKVLILQEVKRNGDQAINTMVTLIKADGRGLQSLDGSPICNTTGTTYAGDIYMVDSQDNRFMFHDVLGRIASESARTDYLTTDKVAISNFQLSCQRDSQFTGPLISISFDVAQALTTTRAEESVTLPYQTKVRLRNY
jgi:prepilin-type N-terminal cleavage/methylation domain-containing protein